MKTLTEELWDALHATGDTAVPLPPLTISGAPGGLPSVFAVESLALATVSVATAAVAELLAVRSGAAVRAVTIDRGHVAAAFRSERLLEPVGWKQPEIWDPIAGDYRTADGWIRIHTNYAHHRAAAVAALGGVPVERDAVAAAVRARAGDELEAAIVAAGGAAARMRTLAEWSDHPQGRAVAEEPLVATELARCAGAGSGGPLPLSGIRVLDLTRVIAGPVCTRVLAAYGADVLRLDPPGFREVGALLPETTAGKRRAALDLRSVDGRATFLELVDSADVLVCGYRNTSLAQLDLDVAALRAVNPALVVARLDAYGWTGPWRDRRGFDSLVQMSTGIAERSRTGDSPGALPAQALDHGCGYLLAATVSRALTRRQLRGVTTAAHLSLARLASLLVGLGEEGDANAPLVRSGDPFREREESSLGTILRVRVPGAIAGVTSRFTRPAGQLGVDPPSWS